MSRRHWCFADTSSRFVKTAPARSRPCTEQQTSCCRYSPKTSEGTAKRQLWKANKKNFFIQKAINAVFPDIHSVLWCLVNTLQAWMAKMIWRCSIGLLMIDCALSLIQKHLLFLGYVDTLHSTQILGRPSLLAWSRGSGWANMSSLILSGLMSLRKVSHLALMPEITNTEGVRCDNKLCCWFLKTWVLN